MTKSPVKKYSTLTDAMNCEMSSTNVFIIANECRKADGSIGRYYSVFESINIFLKYRNRYPNCHEILVDHVNNEPNIAGRLVFDFDISLDYELPNNFKDIVEDCIFEVITYYFNDIDANLFEYVWSSSANPLKCSKHLTVKNLYFDNWIVMSKIFYKLFAKHWDNCHDWIESDKLVDFQIIRKHASLRMVGSSKLDGHILTFDDETKISNKTNSESDQTSSNINVSIPKLVDSFIRIYDGKIEQIVTKSHINMDAINQLIDYIAIQSESGGPILNLDELKQNACCYTITDKNNAEPIYPQSVYDNAMYIFNLMNPNKFKISKIRGKKINLVQKTKSKCIICNRKHEHENGYLYIKLFELNYTIYYGCYRVTDHWKYCVKIGTFTLIGDTIHKYSIQI